MSHSNDLGVFAVGRSRNLGVDIESLAEVMRAEDVIARILTEHERLSLAPLSPDERGKEFLTLWTRKEAYLKATGMGIGQGVQDVKVPMLVELRGERVQPEVGGESFFFYDLQCPVPEFSASLVIAPASDTLARPQVTQSRR
jgi:4'-phosphopantetheinyl transferase